MTTADPGDRRPRLDTSHDRSRALETLAARCAGKGFHIAHDMLGSGAEAEDAVQEALARACERFDKIRDPAAIEGWFYRVLTNHCLSALRRRRVTTAVLAIWPSSQARRSTPAHELEPDVSRLLRAIDRLPAKQKAAVVLRYGHDISLDEIADMLGVGRGTVKTHLVRGLKRLRTLLEVTND